MAEKLIKVIKVFLASPGGLELERQAASRIVNDINASHSERWGVSIKLVGWEITLPGYARAQSLINKDLDECGYFIGMLSRQWGSPPSDSDGRYGSGFEEEYFRSVDHIENGQMKNIQLFFKTIPPDLLRDPGVSLQKVIAFRDQCAKNRKPFFKEFETLADFERMFRLAIEQIGWDETSVLRAPNNPMLPDARPDETLVDSGNRLFGPKAAAFIGDLLQRRGSWDSTQPQDIARLRLIALGLSRPGNDDQELGVHDANLVFANRSHFDLGKEEVSELINAGIANFRHQNTPIWHWIASDPSGPRFERVSVVAAFGRERSSENAFRLLLKARQPLPIFDILADSDTPAKFRKQEIERWLSRESDAAQLAALDLIAAQGDQSDIDTLEGLRAQASPGRANALAIAIIKILSVGSPLKALKYAAEANPDPIPLSVLDQVFMRPASLTTEALLQSLPSKSDVLRTKVASALARRSALDVDTSQRLIKDSHVEVRFWGAVALDDIGHPLDEAALRKVLIVEKPKGLFGLGLLAAASLNQADVTWLDKFLSRRLLKLSRSALKQRAASATLFDERELEALYLRYGREEASDIRANLDDGFASYFARKLQKIETAIGENTELVAKIKNLESYIRRQNTTSALTALAQISDKQDLSLIRKTIATQDVDIDDVVIKYLGQHGDWSDIERISQLHNVLSKQTASLLHSPPELWPTAGKALHKLAKYRLADLLQLETSVSLKRSVLRQLTKGDMASLGDDFLINTLNEQDERLRKMAAVKCAQHLSKARLAQLLKGYLGQSIPHFYNVIHWLDLGISMPRAIVQDVTRGEFDESD